MLILEGPDCGGKTTLLKKLKDEFNPTDVTHYSEHEPEVMLGHATVAGKKADDIADRFHLSEIPYSIYYRCTSPNYNSVAEIDQELHDQKAVIILCIPPWPEARKNWRARVGSELVKDPVVYSKIYAWYNAAAMAYTSVDILRYDYTIPEAFPNLIKQLKGLFDGT
jgi:hypothetical protein